MTTDLIQKAKELEQKHVKSKRKNLNAPEKSPRQYAAEILALTENERMDALKKVPSNFFTWVAGYVNDPHAEQRIVNSTAAAIARIKGIEKRHAALLKVPAMFRDQVKAAATAIFNKQREAIKNEGTP